MSDFLQSGAMSLFLFHISIFPTVIFTGLVLFVMLYWLTVLLGVFELDSGDMEFGDGDMLAGLLMKFGLNDVPILIILTFFSLIGWIVSFVLMNVLAFVSQDLLANVVLRTTLGAVVLLATVAIALWLTSLFVRPTRRVAKSNPTTTASRLLGKVATVRTMTVDKDYGEAVLEDGGAGLILKVRAFDTTFSQGDKVRLMAYLSEQNAYHVVADS